MLPGEEKAEPEVSISTRRTNLLSVQCPLSSAPLSPEVPLSSELPVGETTATAHADPLRAGPAAPRGRGTNAVSASRLLGTIVFPGVSLCPRSETPLQPVTPWAGAAQKAELWGDARPSSRPPAPQEAVRKGLPSVPPAPLPRGLPTALSGRRTPWDGAGEILWGSQGQCHGRTAAPQSPSAGVRTPGLSTGCPWRRAFKRGFP